MLIDFIKGLLPSFNKGEILEDIRITMGELDNGVLDAWRVSASYYETAQINAKENIALQKQFFTAYNKRSGKTAKNMILEIASVMPDLKVNLLYTEKKLNEALETKIFTETMDAKKRLSLRQQNAFPLSLVLAPIYCYTSTLKNLSITTVLVPLGI
jgi:hypothetical protein